MDFRPSIMDTTPTALPPRRALALKGGPGTVVTVTAGRVWLTETGIDADRFVAAGESHVLRGRGPVVVECDGAAPAVFRVERRPGLAVALAGLAARAARRTARGWPRWRAWGRS